ncbi:MULTISPECIES: DUF6531 domain-containing protein [Cupriavidus]
MGNRKRTAVTLQGQSDVPWGVTWARIFGRLAKFTFSCLVALFFATLSPAAVARYPYVYECGQNGGSEFCITPKIGPWVHVVNWLPPNPGNTLDEHLEKYKNYQNSNHPPGERIVGFSNSRDSGGYYGFTDYGLMNKWYTDIDWDYGAVSTDASFGVVSCPAGTKLGTDKIPPLCVFPSSRSELSCPIGDPILPASGVVLEAEVDIVGMGQNALSVTRSYRSEAMDSSPGAFGLGWRTEWHRRLQFSGATPTIIRAVRADGSAVDFKSSANNEWLAIGKSRDKLLSKQDPQGKIIGWRYEVGSDDSYESYDDIGLLQAVKSRNGQVISLRYSDQATSALLAPGPGYLLAVSNQFGLEISFSYTNQGQISTIASAGDVRTNYAYDASGRLAQVTWPDGRSRQYIYEDSRWQNALTGVIDEALSRYVTYSYDSTGKAIGSEHPGGIGRVRIAYTNDSQLSVTASNNTISRFTFETGAGYVRPIEVSAPCVECGNVAKTTAYDTGGNVSRRVGFDSKETRFSYDVQGREIQRIDGYGTANVKTTTTEWHPTWNLPLKVAGPGRIDGFDYDLNGRVTSYAWYPTSDGNGSQGTSAAPTGSIARTQWAYNEQGLLATIAESVDGNAIGQWAFAYDPLGNLSSVTTPEGKTGRALRYDSTGRMLEAIDADGNHQQYVYNSRGQIIRYDVAGKTVIYEYNALGFLTAVRGPGGSYIGYEYDDAHHLQAFLLQPGATETVSTISPFSTAQTTVDSGNVKNASVWRRVWGWIKSWLGELVGNAHAQSSVQRIPVVQAPAQAGAECTGTGCQQTFLDCLANCIRAYDPLSDEFKVALTGLGGTFPKAMVGLPRGLGGASRMTTVPSALAHGLGGGGAGTSGGAARVVGRVVSPVWIGYGVYLAGMEGYCTADCAMNACSH